MLRVVGEVRDQSCVIIDDMISTGGTISRSIVALLEAGARPEIYVVATHGLLLPGAREKLSHDSYADCWLQIPFPWNLGRACPSSPSLR